MNKFSLTSISILTVSLSNIGNASVVTLDPSEFASGTNVTTAYQGTTLYSARMYMPYPKQTATLVKHSDVTVVDCIGCKPQVNETRVFGFGSLPVFSYEMSFAGYLRNPVGSSDGTVLMTVFDHPTNYVQIIGSGATTFTAFGIDYWGSDNQWLGRCGYGNFIDNACSMVRLETPPNPYNTFNTDQRIYTLNLSNPDIAFVTMGGVDGPGYVSRISYNQLETPLPAAAILFSSSLIGLICSARRPLTKINPSSI